MELKSSSSPDIDDEEDPEWGDVDIEELKQDN